MGHEFLRSGMACHDPLDVVLRSVPICCIDDRGTTEATRRCGAVAAIITSLHSGTALRCRLQQNAAARQARDGTARTVCIGMRSRVVHGGCTITRYGAPDDRHSEIHGARLAARIDGMASYVRQRTQNGMPPHVHFASSACVTLARSAFIANA